MSIIDLLFLNYVLMHFKFYGLRKIWLLYLFIVLGESQSMSYYKSLNLNIVQNLNSKFRASNIFIENNINILYFILL